MKKLILVLWVCACFYACQSPAARTQAFIPGTYVCSGESDYSVANDTLLVTPLDAHHYQLERRTAYHAIRQGKRLPARHQVKTYQALWDPLKQELDEQSDGLIFRFDAEKGVLYAGKAVYQKLK